MSAVETSVVPRRSARNAVITLVTMALFTGTAARYVLSPMQELVRLDLGFSDNQMAMLQGMALAIPAALLSIPLGRLVDRTNRTRLLVFLALICATGSVLTAFAQSFTTAFLARVLVGAAVVAAQPAALSLVADVTEATQRGRMIMLTSLGQTLGGTAAYMLAGPLLQWLPSALHKSGSLAALAPWRLVQLVFAVAVLVATLALLFMREPTRREAGGALGGNLSVALRELWGYRKFLLPLLGGMVTVGMADAAASVWAVPVLTRAFHLAPADFGTWMGLLFLGSSVIGAVIGGITADYGQRRRGRAGSLIGAVSAAALSIPAALFPVMPGVGLFAVLMGVLLTCGACVNIAATSAIMVILPNELRGISMSLLVAVIGLAAFGAAPLLVSLAAWEFSHGADVAISLACLGLITSVLGTISLVVAVRVAALPATGPAAAVSPPRQQLIDQRELQ